VRARLDVVSCLLLGWAKEGRRMPFKSVNGTYSLTPDIALNYGTLHLQSISEVKVPWVRAHQWLIEYPSLAPFLR